MIIFTFIASIISVLGDTFLKKAALKNNSIFLLLGMVIYVFTAFLWFHIYKTNRFSVVNLLYSVFLILFSLGIGVFYFKEKLSLLELFGVILGLISVLILSSKNS